MKRTLALVFSAFLPLAAGATDPSIVDGDAYLRPAEDSDLSEFLWINRPVIVFADTPADPRFQEQIKALTEGAEMMIERDVVVLTDTDPDTLSPLRKKLRPRGFQLVLVGKDGSVKLRKPSPWSVREISRSIDKTPMRQREIRDRRAAP
ncbi:protein of unknown function [Cribrihabitans marinus]|uniref:DUF4174 domain-containing protein n=2 Tax=Cribrihabitans marinus TaxID=1227549 RepID=A0A1H6ZJ11_9RHOB|nr:DUF4174 domain-containing protein [Cribrihabitans marinus]GGH30521.1 hypothetical protein GCM10010973_20740 [Cribrihabitans marinus]SEJ53533.1 protein of unknown function [Cribrihabitans marinus]